MLVKDLRTLYSVGSVGELSDAQLLERFVACRDEAVFELYVERHGPMVLQICRGILGNAHDAEDAFQATFLVLVHQAGSIRNRESMASWLFGVARRIAARVRVDAARRRKHERRVAEMASRSDVQDESPGIGPVLCEEVAKLPEKYREVVVLCCFEGNSYEAAARRLGRPIGTVKVRLSRAQAVALSADPPRARVACGRGGPRVLRGSGRSCAARACAGDGASRAGTRHFGGKAPGGTVLEEQDDGHRSRSSDGGPLRRVRQPGAGVSLIRGLPIQHAGSIRNTAAPKPRSGSLLVRVVDASGSPLAGAQVGGGAHGSSKDKRSDWEFYSPRTESDAAGIAELMNIKVIEQETTLLLYVYHERLGLAGIKEVSKDDLGKTVTVVLERACHVRGRLTSSGMSALKRPVGWTNVYVCRGESRLLSFSSESQEYHFFLPSGTYKLSAYGTDCDRVETLVEVESGMRDVEVSPIDLPPTRVAALLGRPALSCKGSQAGRTANRFGSRTCEARSSCSTSGVTGAGRACGRCPR